MLEELIKLISDKSIQYEYIDQNNVILFNNGIKLKVSYNINTYTLSNIGKCYINKRYLTHYYNRHNLAHIIINIFNINDIENY